MLSQLSIVRGVLFEVCFSLGFPFPMASLVLDSVSLSTAYGSTLFVDLYLIYRLGLSHI